VARTCGTCGRTWDRRATFCGACGDLLDESSTSTRDRGPGRAWWRHPTLLVTTLALAVVGVVAAVPRLTVERVAPVDGEIGVPAADELRVARAGAGASLPVAAPEISCDRQGVATDCVAWSRALVDPATADGTAAWVVAAGDRLLTGGEDRVEAVDPRTGRRQWRLDVDHPHRPTGVVEGGVVLAGGGTTTMVDLATGEARWAVPTDDVVWGDVAVDGLVLTGASGGDGTGIVARDVSDGSERWRWSGGWGDALVRPLGDRVLVASGIDGSLALLDATSGSELARTDQPNGWLIGITDTTAVYQTVPTGNPGGPNPAGDPGATLVGLDLQDLGVRWERRVRASDVGFGVLAGIVVAPSTGRLTGIDAATGAVAWEVETDGPAASAGSTEVVAYHGPLDAFGPTLAPATPVLVTLEPAGGRVRGRDPATGAVLWQSMAETDLHHALVGDGIVLVLTSEGHRVLDIGDGTVRVHVRAPNTSPISRFPLLLLHHESGYVVRVRSPEAGLP
jgi:outer membrane protein assembly factor BamB